MSVRRVSTGVTLVVLLVVLVGMAVYGFRAVTAPLPGGGSTTADCSSTEKQVKKFLARSEVQVSVFNASGRGGLAGTTLERLEEAGFRAGNAGNAPERARVRRAVVWAKEPDETAARLVARSFGKRTRIVVTDADLGPGVDVLVGDRFSGLDRKAPDRLRLPAPVETCVEVS